MAVKVYVGNLSESVTPKDLQQLFENFGVIEEVAILGKYAFVHFQRNEDANDSIKALNNTEFMGTIIRVEVSHTRNHSNKDGDYRRHDNYHRGRDDKYRRGYGDRYEPSYRDRRHDDPYDRHDDRYHHPDDRYRRIDDRYHRHEDRFHRHDDRYHRYDNHYDDHFHRHDDRYHGYDDRYYQRRDPYRERAYDRSYDRYPPHGRGPSPPGYDKHDSYYYRNHR